MFVCNTCIPHIIPNASVSMGVAPPQMLDPPNLGGLKRACQRYIDEVAELGGKVDDDYPHYIFEEAVQALFGPEVFKWINKR